jgi:ABC-type sugar transport system ATPase subunit
VADIALDAVTKNYGDVLAVNQASFDIDDGQFTVLVGPSGCGKTTLLRLIAGLEDMVVTKPYHESHRAGEIRIGGRVANSLTPAQRNIAMVFQNFALYPHKTARDNMSLSLRVRKVSPSEVRQRVDRVAALLQVSNLLDRYPREMSGGQQQRVALGRAIVRDPSVLMMDEPLSNLDAKLRTQMRTELKQLQTELRTTTVYVTHDQAEAMSMADRLVVMNQGVVQQIGLPADVYDRPCNVFVAGLMGSPTTNFLDAELAERDGSWSLAGLGFSVTLDVSLAADRPTAQQVLLGLRPEHLHLVASHGGPGTLTLSGRVALIEALGAETFLHLDSPAGRIVMRADTRSTPDQGANVTVGCDQDRVMLFDAETERRVDVLQRAPVQR